MQAGKLRHRVTIQEPVMVQNPETGAVNKTWRDLATVWAEVSPLSAREFIAAQASQGEITTRITIRFRPGITRMNRILFRGEIYNIDGVLPDPKSGREYLTLPCSEGVNDG
ncbi:phage head closure protein [Enterobacter hormaechei]|uniref:phage head closure protein n=1 Tax=Enterobacter TaxID=547 RepID=UPI00190A5C30|nr:MULTISPECIES: phage head closure protein [Enterobacter]MBK4414170.1 phage head closure protein [Enterobacter hormaechei]MBY0635511.1 phage head closure protein [Enterobacter sp. NIC22-4]UER82140.1 phage head closure protein [Enterobacter cloacae]